MGVRGGNVDDVHVCIFDQVLIGRIWSGFGLLSRRDDFGDELVGRGQGRRGGNGGNSMLDIVDVAGLGRYEQVLGEGPRYSAGGWRERRSTMAA